MPSRSDTSESADASGSGVGTTADSRSGTAAAGDVLVVGGGLGGLALAAYLDRHGATPTVVERRSEWGDGGYGIGLWADGQAVLADLGRLDGVRAAATDPDAVAVRAAGGDRLARLRVPGDRSLLLAVHRGDLHAVLREAVPDDHIRMGTEPSRIEDRRDGVRVTFADGGTERFDAVVGADGVHSTVRRSCFPDATVREHDTRVWSLWAEQTVDLGAEMVSVWGPGSEGFVARVGDRVGFNLAARHDDVVGDDPRAGLREHAAAIGWRLPDLLDGTDAAPFTDRVRTVSCPTWHSDRVVLLGDAAHAVHPISGMGASLALQDARALAQELLTTEARSTAAAPYRRAFERYAERRRPAAERVRREARFEAAVTFLDSPALRRLRNGLVRRTPLFEWVLRRQLHEPVG